MSDERRAVLLRYAQDIINGKEPHAAAQIARGLEDEIERRGFQEAYIEALDAAIRLAPPVPFVWQTLAWAFLRATHDQRARAFIAAMEKAS